MYILIYIFEIHKVKKYSKIRQEFKNVISNFACFFTAIANV